MDQIKQVLDERLRLSIDKKTAESIIKFTWAYQTRGSHGEAFNSPYLGLHPCFFLNKDRDDFFNLLNIDVKDTTKLISSHIKRDSSFGVTTRSFTDVLKNIGDQIRRSTSVLGFSASDMRKIINDITSIDNNFKVVSDPFNILTVYVLHCIYISALPTKLKHDSMFAVIMLLQYKFFTSLVNHRFKYKPDEGVMRAMYERMSNKFDIKQMGTWYNVMSYRANQILDEQTSIHINTLKKFDNDKSILYVITDIQTRIRNQINIVTEEFMKAKADNDKIGIYSHVGTDTEGDKVIMADTNGFDMMIASVYQDTQSVPKLLDDQALRITTGLFKAVNIHKLRSLLIGFSELSVKRVKSNQQDLMIKKDDMELCIGPKVLIQTIIQKSYRYCINNGVDLNQKIAIVKAIKDVYSSSRISDPGILLVRDSVNELISELVDSSREATVSAYRIAFILYIVILSLKYLK